MLAEWSGKGDVDAENKDVEPRLGRPGTWNIPDSRLISACIPPSAKPSVHLLHSFIPALTHLFVPRVVCLKKALFGSCSGLSSDHNSAATCYLISPGLSFLICRTGLCQSRNQEEDPVGQRAFLEGGECPINGS